MEVTQKEVYITESNVQKYASALRLTRIDRKHLLAFDCHVARSKKWTIRKTRYGQDRNAAECSTDTANCAIMCR